MDYNKKEIRKLIKNKRDLMERDEIFSKSTLIFEQLVTMPEYKRAEKIFTYVSTNNEVDTVMLIDYSLSIEKRVFVPRVSGNTMDFYEISDISELSPGYFGIFEPDINGKEPDFSRNGLFVMPAVALDKEFNRLGYGGGFYDRYLATDNKFNTVVLAYEFQFVDKIPAEESDIRPQMIITESNVYRHLDY